ncbi:MAG: zinc ribbon domain-containing protein [Pseudobdellovibrionaceae bacterium]
MSQQKCPSCASCGMPMEKSDDFALSKTTSVYCKYCTDEAGNLLPFDKILKANADYFKESQGITEAASIKMAQDLLKSQPAWKNVNI